MATDTDIKSKLHEACMEFVKKRIKNAEEAIVSYQEAANEESKSSAGDKYVTGRAMMQREVENLSVQLNEARKLEEILINMNPKNAHNEVTKGALVNTTQGDYYVAVSAGQLKIDDNTYFAVTPASPIGTKMEGLRAGDSFELNNKKITIKEVH